MLSNDRKLYDLCRKYKYYYKAYQKIKPLKEVYWSKYLEEAYDEVENELENIENEIIFLIFDNVIDEWSTIQIDRDVIKRYDLNRAFVHNLRVSVYDSDFVDLMKKYMDNRREKQYNAGKV